MPKTGPNFCESELFIKKPHIMDGLDNKLLRYKQAIQIRSKKEG